MFSWWHNPTLTMEIDPFIFIATAVALQCHGFVLRQFCITLHKNWITEERILAMLGSLHLRLHVLVLCCIFDVCEGTKCESVQEKIRPVNKFVALLGFSVCHSTSYAVRADTPAILFRKHHFSSSCTGALTQKVTSPASSNGR